MDMTANRSNTYVDKNLDSTMKIVFDKLSEALDDVRSGRVLTEEDLWAEYDKDDFIK